MVVMVKKFLFCNVFNHYHQRPPNEAIINESKSIVFFKLIDTIPRTETHSIWIFAPPPHNNRILITF